MPEQRSRLIDDAGDRTPRTPAGAGGRQVPAWIVLPAAAGLIAIVALASRSASFTPPSGDIDLSPVLTTAEVIGYVGLGVGTVALLLGAALWRGRMRHLKPERLFGTKRETAPVPWWMNLLALVTLFGVLAFEVVVLIAYINELRRLADQAAAGGGTGDDGPLGPAFGTAANDPTALIVAIAIMVGLGALLVVYALRTRLLDDRGTGAWVASGAASTVAAVDLSLGALRSEPDPRRAVIAAYAAMERSLSGAGVARRRSEAPLEYLRRVLASPALAADEVRTLTNLFQHAKFSEHTVDETMRRGAIDALERIRVAAGGQA